MEGKRNTLTLDWVLGFNKDMIRGVHNLTDGNRDALFYVSAHTGIIYDTRYKKQYLLQGHTNPISSCCVSDDKKWIVTADAGSESMLVVWDSRTRVPIRTIFSPHRVGVSDCDISADGKFVVTLSYVDVDAEEGDPSASEQEIAVWDWTEDVEKPVARCRIPTPDIQHCVRFSRENNRLLVTNGVERTVFWSWNEEDMDKMRFYSPAVNQSDYRQPVGDFTQSVFIPGTNRALSGTSDGDVLVWIPAPSGRPTDMVATKLVRLTSGSGAILCLGFYGKYLYAGTADGAVRFYDEELRLIAWFEDIQAGPVCSISFAGVDGSVGKPDTTQPAASKVTDLQVPDFIIGSMQGLVVGMQASMFQKLTPDQRRGTLLLQGLDDEISCVTTHPREPYICVVTMAGTVHVWDTAEKSLLIDKTFDVATFRPVSAVYDRQGRFLVLGSTTGVVLVLQATDLQQFQAPLVTGKSTITDIAFSPDGYYMATAGADNAVTIFRFLETEVKLSSEALGGRQEWELDEHERSKARRMVEQWVLIGRYKAHSKPITGLRFGMSAEGAPLLVSTGEDKYLVEYDLEGSSVKDGIQLRGGRTKIEQSATPTTCAWYPSGTSSKEQFIVTASNEYKFKLWNANNKACRRTVVAPTFGGPINRLIFLPEPSMRQQQLEQQEENKAEQEAASGGADDGSTAQERTTASYVEAYSESSPGYFVYSTAERVVGLVKLPLDGNPHKCMGLIAHPGEVSSVDVTSDGKYLITAGGADETVNLWRIDTDALDDQAAKGGVGIEPFLDLLEGGAAGEFLDEIKNYFVYAQIRSQGEDSTKPRSVGSKVPLGELPNLMRALGYYPTEAEVANLIGEVKYKDFTQTGKLQDSVTLNELIKLYVNHRPVLGIGKGQIAEALSMVKRAVEGEEGDSLKWASMATVLTQEAERFSDQELAACLRALTGSAAPPHSVNPSSMAKEILGFEDHEEEDMKEDFMNV